MLVVAMIKVHRYWNLMKPEGTQNYVDCPARISYCRPLPNSANTAKSFNYKKEILLCFDIIEMFQPNQEKRIENQLFYLFELSILA